MSETFAGEPLDPHAMKTENARLRAELAAAVAHAQEANKVVEDCEAKNAKLREALEPFAVGIREPDEIDRRRAAEAYHQTGGESGCF